MQRSLDLLVERHEPLRTSLRFQDGDVVQVIPSALNIPINVIDHSDLDTADRLSAALAAAAARAAEPFDLERRRCPASHCIA